MATERRGERGQGIVEMAILLPILIMLTMGAIDLGRVYFAYSGLVNAAREGAMHASARPTDIGGIQAAVIAELGGALPGAVTTTVGGGTASGSAITVTVRYDFNAVTTAILARGTFPIQANATMVVQ